MCAAREVSTEVERFPKWPQEWHDSGRNSLRLIDYPNEVQKPLRTKNRWTIPHVDNDTAIGTLVFFTMKHAFEKYSCLADSFEIEMTMDIKVNDGNGTD